MVDNIINLYYNCCEDNLIGGDSVNVIINDKSIPNLGIINRKITLGEEYDLVTSFIEKAIDKQKKKNNNKGVAILVEPEIDFAFPDVVVADYDPNMYKNWTEKRNGLSKSDIRLLYYLINYNVSSATDLFKKIGLNSQKALTTLEKLYDCGLVLRKNGYWCATENANAFGVTNLRVIEAKIGKWDEVITQAVANKRFASESYVLTKLKNQPENRTIMKLTQNQLGLYLYKNEDIKTFLKSPKGKQQCNLPFLWINEVVGRLANAQ